MARFNVGVCVLALLCAAPAWAQNAAPVIPLCGTPGAQTACSVSNPLPITGSTTSAPGTATTTPTGGAVATQNVFQSVLASNPTRKGASVENTSASDTLYVFFGANGSAAKPTSFQLAAGATIQATTLTGYVLTDNISVTCANAVPANCTFVVGAQ